MMAKKSLESGADMDSLPESMRQLLAMQAMEAGRPFPGQMMGRPGVPMALYGGGSMMMGTDPNSNGKVGTFSSTINIKTWTPLT